MTTMDDETLRTILDGLRHGPVHITADRCSGDSRAVNAFCDLIKAAPALAAEVLRLRAERDELRGVCDDLSIDVTRARDALDVPRETGRGGAPDANAPLSALQRAAAELTADLLQYAGPEGWHCVAACTDASNPHLVIYTTTRHRSSRLLAFIGYRQGPFKVKARALGNVILCPKDGGPHV
jgi:hypothetical protein